MLWVPGNSLTFPGSNAMKFCSHYQGGHTLQNIKKLSYWRNCDSCYEENSFKKIYIFLFFYISLFCWDFIENIL